MSASKPCGWTWNEDLGSYVDDISEGRYCGFVEAEIDYSPKLVIGFQLTAKPRYRVRARSRLVVDGAS